MQKWWLVCFIVVASACSSNQTVNYESLDIQYVNDIPRFEQNGAPFNGVAVEHFSELKIEHHISDGLEEKQLGFYLSGEKEREFNFSKGKKHGLCTMWWKDGTLLLEEHYENGDLHGDVIRYNPDGSILESKKYINGILDVLTDSSDEPSVNAIQSDSAYLPSNL